jgi:hypothetical protein
VPHDSLFVYFRVLPKNDENLADLLHRMRIELLAERFHPDVARVAVLGRRAHLDQLVRLERAVDFRDDFVGEPLLVADDDDRGELVCLGAQLAAAGRG